MPVSLCQSPVYLLLNCDYLSFVRLSCLVSPAAVPSNPMHFHCSTLLCLRAVLAGVQTGSGAERERKKKRKTKKEKSQRAARGHNMARKAWWVC